MTRIPGLEIIVVVDPTGLIVVVSGESWVTTDTGITVSMSGLLVVDGTAYCVAGDMYWVGGSVDGDVVVTLPALVDAYNVVVEHGEGEPLTMVVNGEAMAAVWSQEHGEVVLSGGWLSEVGLETGTITINVDSVCWVAGMTALGTIITEPGIVTTDMSVPLLGSGL